jgi:hypothetical protein
VLIELSQRFIHQYQKLPSSIRLKIDKACLSLMESDFRRPNCRLIEGASSIFENLIDTQYRFTFERRSDAFVLRNIDNQEDCLRSF